MITDPISDFLTRLRNAQAAGHEIMTSPSSRMKFAIAKILANEGFVSDVSVSKDGPKATIEVRLKYNGRVPVIKNIRRISTPGRRVYRGASELPRVLSDLGIAIVSTSAGIMTNKEARKRRLGGEVICEVF